MLLGGASLLAGFGDGYTAACSLIAGAAVSKAYFVRRWGKRCFSSSALRGSQSYYLRFSLPAVNTGGQNKFRCEGETANNCVAL
jgi:hypothetical protein